MIIFLGIPAYIFIHIVLGMLLIRFLGAVHPVFRNLKAKLPVLIAFWFCVLSIFIDFVMPAGSDVKRFFRAISVHWLGILLYSLIVIIAAFIIRFIIRKIRRLPMEHLKYTKSHAVGGSICAAVIAAICIAGTVNAHCLHTEHYEVTVNKQAGHLTDLNVVLASDLHMGYVVGENDIQNMVDEINAQDPDIVVIAGDMFDNEYEAIRDPERMAEILSGIKSRYGTYACYGNHDVSEKLLGGFEISSDESVVRDPGMYDLLENAGITLLEDEYVLVEDSFYIYGRPDGTRRINEIGTRKTPSEITAGLDLSKPVFVIDHQPGELKALDAAGVDIDFSGHTHDGQFFPGNIFMKFKWQNPDGYLKTGNMHSFVSSGVGVFAPVMRVGTSADICQITVHFSN